MNEVIRKERDQAQAQRKEDYAKKPASFKSSLSLALPVGTTRKKENHRANSPERQHVYIENKAVYRGPVEDDEGGQNSDKKQSAEEKYEKMKMLRDKYGDSSAQGQTNKK